MAGPRGNVQRPQAWATLPEVDCSEPDYYEIFRYLAMSVCPKAFDMEASRRSREEQLERVLENSLETTEEQAFRTPEVGARRLGELVLECRNG